jgi:hypothetical protein
MLPAASALIHFCVYRAKLEIPVPSASEQQSSWWTFALRRIICKAKHSTLGSPEFILHGQRRVNAHTKSDIINLSPSYLTAPASVLTPFFRCISIPPYPMTVHSLSTRSSRTLFTLFTFFTSRSSCPHHSNTATRVVSPSGQIWLQPWRGHSPDERSR